MTLLNKNLGCAALICLFLLLAGCGETETGEFTPVATRETFSQWVDAVTVSSEYSFPDWSRQRVIGVPDVNACVDDSRAWASARGNGAEWLELEFRVPVFATEVKIYQTHGRGAISRVSIYDPEGNRQVVWEGTDQSAPCPGTLSVPIPLTAYRVSSVRVDLDESRTGYWNQIDAVELIGFQ